MIAHVACQTPLSKGSKNVSPSLFFLFSHPGLQNLAQLFLVPVIAQVCNKLSSNELGPPVLGDVSASCFSAGTGSGIFFSSNIDRMAEVFRFSVSSPRYL